MCIALQVLYPVLMMVMVSRTYFSKVRPDKDIAFRRNAAENQGTSSGSRSFAARVQTSLKEEHSMFAWASKGQWESVNTPDEELKRDRNWFRIGFEPLFVDFTKSGSWFLVYMLVEVRRWFCARREANSQCLDLSVAARLLLLGYESLGATFRGNGMVAFAFNGSS